MQQEIYLHCKHPRFLSPDVTEKNTWWKVEHVFWDRTVRPVMQRTVSHTHTHTHTHNRLTAFCQGLTG